MDKEAEARAVKGYMLGVPDFVITDSPFGHKQGPEIMAVTWFTMAWFIFSIPFTSLSLLFP